MILSGDLGPQFLSDHVMNLTLPSKRSEKYPCRHLPRLRLRRQRSLVALAAVCGRGTFRANGLAAILGLSLVSTSTAGFCVTVVAPRIDGDDENANGRNGRIVWKTFGTDDAGARGIGGAGSRGAGRLTGGIPAGLRGAGTEGRAFGNGRSAGCVLPRKTSEGRSGKVVGIGGGFPEILGGVGGAGRSKTTGGGGAGLPKTFGFPRPRGFAVGRFGRATGRVGVRPRPRRPRVGLDRPPAAGAVAVPRCILSIRRRISSSCVRIMSLMR